MKHITLILGVLAFTCFGLIVHKFRLQIEERQQVIDMRDSEIFALKEKLSRLQFSTPLSNLASVFVITPTYARPVQQAELVRLLNCFRQVPNLHWIIVEDASSKSKLVTSILQEFPHNSTHLNILTPEHQKIQPKEAWYKKPRGVFQRNLALSWLRANTDGVQGIFYFADDDNTYTVDLFEEIRNTKKVSIFPVGLVGGVLAEKPAVKDGKVVGFEVGWGADRKFATDMAGFAVNLQYFKEHKDVQFPPKVRIGRLETDFLNALISVQELEPVSMGRLLVWHTRTEKPNLNREEYFVKKFGHNSDFGLEL